MQYSVQRMRDVDKLAFPFVTIDVVFYNNSGIGVLNDNNFPFSVGCHVATGALDDDEFIVIQLDQPLGNL
jgi:glycerophosphoryl diester phosphodiesterase